MPKSYSTSAVTDLVAAIDGDRGSTRRSDWCERDRAIVFMSLLTGLRASEILNANVGDIRRTQDGGVLHVDRGRQRRPHALQRLRYRARRAFDMIGDNAREARERVGAAPDRVTLFFQHQKGAERPKLHAGALPYAGVAVMTEEATERAV